MPRPQRERFALTGPSRVLDPRTHAVRADLADVRLAEQVFAPHYAAPLPLPLARDAVLVADDGTVLAELAAGDVFEALEFAGARAWGVAVARRLVGYVDLAAVEPRAR